MLENFKLWNKEDRDARLIAALIIFIGILLIIIGLLWYGWKSSPKEIEVRQIPNLSSVVTEKIGEIQPSYVYSFAFYVWQMLNHWPNNGIVDYRNLLSDYRQFLTPRMQNQLNRDYQRRLNTNELSRTRIIQGLSGSAYEVGNVRLIDIDTWEVILDVRVLEYMGDVEIKDVHFRYPLKIVKYDINREYNEFGLAVDGFTEEPYRLE